MIKDSLKAIGNSAVGLFRNPLGLLLLCALYFALLACAYVFFATGVASVWQLVLSALAALAVGVIYLLGKLQAHLPRVEEAQAPHAYVASTLAPKPEPLHWQEALVSSLWLLLLGMILPLLAAHLWLSTAHDGLLPTLKKIHRVAARAFAPRSVFIYAVGLFVFGLMPYFILYTRTSVSNTWAELSLFTLRLALAFVFTLLGWTITLGALARSTPDADVPMEQTRAAEPPAPSTETVESEAA